MQPTSTDALHSMSPEEFERLVKRLFESLGYQVEVTRRSHDEGIDLLLDKGKEHSIVQCKRFKGQVGQPVVRDFYGTVMHEKAARGYLVTSGTFSLPAQTWAEGKNLVLVDGSDLLTSMGHLNVAVKTQSKAHRKIEGDALDTVIERLRREGRGSIFPIMFEGEPPSGRSYQQLAGTLASAVGMRLSYGDCRSQPIATTFNLTFFSEPALVFLDEVDAAKRKDLDDLVCALENGYYMVKGAGRRKVIKTIVVSVWEGRLPPRLSRLFSSKIRSSELDWASAAYRLGRWAPEERKRNAEEAKRVEEQAKQTAELVKRLTEEGELKRKAEEREKELERRRPEAEKQIRELYGTKSSVVKVVEPSRENVEYFATYCRFCESEHSTCEPPRTLKTRTLGGYFAGKHVEYLVPTCTACYEKLKTGKPSYLQDKYGRHWWNVPG